MKTLLSLLGILFGLCCTPAWATAYTSVGTGNWNSTSTWSPAGVPGDGDTVTLANGYKVTCPTGVTCVVGTSPSTASTVVLTCSSTSSGTGQIEVAAGATFIYRGSMNLCNAPLIVDAGGTLTNDASLSGACSTAQYLIQSGQNNALSNSGIQFNGTSSQHTTWNSVSHCPSGGYGLSTTRWQDGGNITATYLDASDQGVPGAQSSLSWIRAHPTTALGVVSLSHVTCTNCGMIFGDAAIGAASTFILDYVQITNPSNTLYTLQLDATTTPTTGTRRISHSDIHGYVSILGTNGTTTTGFTIADTLFEHDFAQTSNNFLISGGAPAASFRGVFFFINTDSGSYDYTGMPGGVNTYLYLFRQCDSSPTCANVHPLYPPKSSIDFEQSNCVEEYASDDTTGDFNEPSGDMTVSGKKWWWHNCIFLPNAAGLVVGSLVNNSSCTAQTNGLIVFDHNTAAIGNLGANQVYGVGAECTTTTWPAGAVQSVRNNLVWRSTSGPGPLINSITGSNPASISAGAVVAADYNGIWNVNASVYGTPSTQFATTPGAHDITANPNFVDTTRNFLAADTAFFGNATATAWTSGHSYAVGDEMSYSASGFFGGKTYNYVCIQAHTSSSTNAPGGSGWSANWIPASLVDVRASLLAGTTYNGGSDSVVVALVKWIQAGYAPQNVALHNAGSDGTDIGAVAYKAANQGRGFSLMLP